MLKVGSDHDFFCDVAYLKKYYYDHIGEECPISKLI